MRFYCDHSCFLYKVAKHIHVPSTRVEPMISWTESHELDHEAIELGPRKDSSGFPGLMYFQDYE